MIKNVARKYFFKTTRQSQLRGESFVRTRMSRNTCSKLTEHAFPPGCFYIQFFYIFDTFLKRQTNLKCMFDALSVNLC